VTTSTPTNATERRAGAPAVTTLRGVGPRIAERLEALGIRTIADLLFHLPFRYEDRTRVTAIGSLRPGESAMVRGEIQLADVRIGRRRSLVCRLADGTGSLDLRFFHFTPRQREALARGKRVQCYGEVRRGAARLEMVHPEHQSADDAAASGLEDTLTPVYPATEGLSQQTLRRLAGQAVDRLGADHALPDLLAPGVVARLGLPGLEEALRAVHRPPVGTPEALLASGEHPALKRLAFEELLAHHLSVRVLRRRVERQQAPAIRAPGQLARGLLAALAFEPTGAQQRVVAEIRDDLARGRPMHRLLQGDVGSGKTLVAAIAALDAVEAGHQVALMAPTDLLAEQHLRTLGEWLAPLHVGLEWLAGKVSGRARARVLEVLAADAPCIVVGTHALFQDDVRFGRLGLLVIDEQHRFGVHQRLALRAKGVRQSAHPHQLIMTATPIPRTLAMTAYADLDTSVIDELPPGRSPVDTAVVPDGRRAEVIDRVRRACAAGEQAYWVCTLIEESESLQCQAAADTAASLAEALPELRVGLVHGRMKPVEKDRAMIAFRDGETDLLVATTVIEVGVDVPNASLMIIENAERLGLAQLHQLRGRVGRGRRRSACVLMFHGPLSESARARLAALRQTGDGFEIARRDLELRGPGELLGTRQTGMLQLRIADLARDRELFGHIERAGSEMLRDHPGRVPPLIRRWLGGGAQYADA